MYIYFSKKERLEGEIVEKINFVLATGSFTGCGFFLKRPNP
ncbi:MAG: hypothetical protein ACI8YQ_004514 [Polaribacter sp.]|jgi:hypothetical protein